MSEQGQTCCDQDRMIQEDRLFRAVVNALTEDRLTLPTLPEVAVRVSQISRNDDVSASQLAAEISRDPAIAVRLLRVANSSAMRTGRRVENLQQAVTRLGMGLVRSLVAGLALEQLFFSRAPALRERLRRIWTDSLEVAALSQVLAGHCTLLNPEIAMLAGLVHQIGSLPLLRFAEAQTDGPIDGRQLDQILHKLQPRVGRLVLQAWDFPEELVSVPGSWSDFARQHDGPADYADVVTVAALQSHCNRTERFAGIDRSRVPAFARLDLSPDVDVFELDGVQEEFTGAQTQLAA
jgi:HD-like signal output (HDOD) protein